MPARTKFAWAACEEWHVHEGAERRTYDDLLPAMLDLEHLAEKGGISLSHEQRGQWLDAMRAFVKRKHREHGAQDAAEARGEYQALEKALARAYRVAGQMGEDAALNLDVRLKLGLGFEDGMFDLLGRLRLITRNEMMKVEVRKEPDIIRDLVACFLPLYEAAGGVAGVGARGPFIEVIKLLNGALPAELRASGDLGNRVKDAVEAILEARGSRS
jgi:hypothetical protein